MDMTTLIQLQNSVIWTFIYMGMIVSFLMVLVMIYKIITGDDS